MSRLMWGGKRKSEMCVPERRDYLLPQIASTELARRGATAKKDQIPTISQGRDRTGHQKKKREREPCLGKKGFARNGLSRFR